MEVGILLQVVSHLQRQTLLEVWCQYLQANGQTLAGKAAWYGDAWNTGQASRQGEDIGEVHL